MAKFIMTVGLPASGKTTMSQELSDKHNAVVLSSDKVRKELYGDEKVQGDSSQVFAEVYKRARDLLGNNTNVIVDATNVSMKKRIAAIGQFPKHEKICYYFNTSFKNAIFRNSVRGRTVPIDVIERMFKTLQVPMYDEGWNEIHIVHDTEKYKTYYTEEEINNVKNAIMDTSLPHDHLFYYLKYVPMISKMIDLAQDSTYHTLSVSRHTYHVMQTFYQDEKSRLFALLHDSGKPFTKEFKDGSRYANFIGHENVSGQIAIQFLRDLGYEDNFALEVARLCTLHMKLLHTKGSEKAQEKFKKFVGEETYEYLEFFRKCDENAK